MTAEDGLPPLREVIERHGLLAKKSLGQNFLFDLNLTRRIARTADVRDCIVVEIGPGPGGLTRALLLEGAKHVIAVERDDRAIAALHEIAAAYPGRLTIINGDAMQQKWRDIAPGAEKVVANLPYNIGTPLLIDWITQAPWPPWFSSLTLMFQKEVAERITAKPGTDAYGRLSVLCQWRCGCEKLFDVNRAAFTPPPKITSSIVQLVPRPEAAGDSAALEKVTAAAFGQRRKMLRSSLKAVFDDPGSVCQRLDINSELRAEQLTIGQFLALAHAL